MGNMLQPQPLYPRQTWRARRRPGSLPLFWRAVAGEDGIQGYTRFREWLLVLNACAIPHKVVAIAGREYIYVPPLLEQKARYELEEFSRERAAPLPPVQRTSVHPHAYLAALVFLPLILWHGWRVGWWTPPPYMPAPAVWTELGALDNVRVRLFNEWFRTICALTLHADLPHLCGNVAFGTIFLILLARLTGAGKAVWLTLAGGTLGNGLTVLLRHTPTVTIGFSTALFATIGSIAGFMAKQERLRRKSVLPLAGATALLAMLGTEGDNTDYAAHVAGLCAGLALGWLATVWRTSVLESTPWQLIYAGVAFALPVLAWSLAFAYGG